MSSNDPNQPDGPGDPGEDFAGPAGNAAFPGSGLDHLIAIAVGNTRVRLGLFEKGELRDPVTIVVGNADPVAMPDPATAVELVVAAIRRTAENVHNAPVVMSSVNPRIADRVATALEAEGVDVYRIGSDLSVPLRHTLDDASTLGQDRLVCAFGAFRRSQQACVVIDAGTAITTDFVDGEGVFQGGIIAPGVTMMLRALHEKTAQLPLVPTTRPEATRGPFGKDTRHAMLLGCVNAARGVVRLTIETFAEAYGAYPQIVATGGDAALLFENDDIVEHIVPDLQLMGLYEVAKAALEDDDDEEGAARGRPGSGAPRGLHAMGLDDEADGVDDEADDGDDGDDQRDDQKDA
jgi:type III pantothenate kinase